MREYALSEIKESKLMLDKKPPAFGVIITLITLAFLCGIIVLAGFSPKTYVVKANAIVASENKTYVMNNVSGSIKSIIVEEGQKVQKGDTLLEIDSFNVTLQIEQMKSSLGFILNKKKVIEKLILFVGNFEIANEQSKTNPFDKNNASEVKQYGEVKQFIDYVTQQIEQAEANQGTEDYKPFTQSDVDGLKSQFLAQQYTDISQYEGQAVELESKVKMYHDSLAEYIVKANSDGIVHFNTPLTIGTVLQAGSMIGAVSEDNSQKLYFDTILSATERSKIKVGNAVEIAMLGVMQGEFGVLKGEVIAIATDSTQTENGEVFYRVKIKPSMTTLKDKKGNEISISSGMIAESRIQYDETTWLKWAIEQIGIKFR